VLQTRKSPKVVLLMALLLGHSALALSTSTPEKGASTELTAPAQVTEESLGFTSSSLVGVWEVSTTWTSGFLAGNSGTSIITFYGDGSLQIDNQSVNPRNSWGGSFPNFSYTAYNPNYPDRNEWAYRSFTLDSSGGATTACQATYSHPYNGTAYGRCSLRRVQFVGVWEVSTTWTSGFLAGNSGTSTLTFFDGGSLQIDSQAIDGRNSWGGSFPNHSYIAYNPNYPDRNEWAYRSFTLDSSGRRSTTCQATYSHPYNGTAYGTCHLRRLSYVNYSASNTNHAQQNTIDAQLALQPGQTITVGTCGLPGVYASGDTYLRLMGPNGQTVSLNDDACGSLSSYLVYTVPSSGSGTYQIKAGCYASGSCSGRFGYIVR